MNQRPAVVLLSGGLALRTAVSGPFDGWAVELVNVAVFMAFWAVFMVAAHAVANFVIVPGRRLSSEIIADRNWGVGFVYALLLIAVTLVYTWARG